jgi:hypothetical protein
MSGEVMMCLFFSVLMGVPLLAIFFKLKERHEASQTVAAGSARRAQAMSQIQALKEQAKRGTIDAVDAQAIDAQLVRLQSGLKVGSDVGVYRAELTSLVASVEAYKGNDPAGVGSAFSQLLALAAEHHQDALREWMKMVEAQASHSTGSWSGGGIGLDGAIQGAMLATMLNGFSENTERVKLILETSDTLRQISWGLASECQKSIAEVIQVCAPQRARCANCERVPGNLEKLYTWQRHQVCAGCLRLLGAGR